MVAAANEPSKALASTERAAASLREFLDRHPWPAAWTQFGPTVEHFWTFDVAMPKRALWPHLTDTSAMNKRLGQPEMKFREENGRLVGSTVRSGFKLTWTEVPWQWEYERALTNERIYDSGMLRYNRGIFEVHDLDATHSRVTIYFGGVPRTWLGRLALRYGLSSLREGFRKFFAELETAHAARTAFTAAVTPPTLSDETDTKLREVRDEIVADGVRREIADRIVEFVREGDTESLARIRPRALATLWEIPERELVVAFLHATRRGLFVLSWDTICPHCRGNRAQLQHLGEVPKSSRCDVCEIEFETTDSSALEVTFHLHPSVRVVERVQYCAAEPARRPHIYVQRVVAPGARVDLPTQLPAGRYRIRAHGSLAFVLLDVKPDAEADDVSWQTSERNGARESREQPVIHIENPGDTSATIVVESRDEDRIALRPADLFALQDFRDLFSAESIAADVQLDIGKQTILFTDVVGSTRYYEQVGDAVAFAAVRRHFLEAYAIVKKHGGVIVKTIGDAVMGAFTDPASAVRASIEMQRFFNGKNDASALRLRVTIHAGRCIAVNLNSNIDYFGSTVNLAAKLQAIAGAGEIAFTPDVNADTAVRDVLARESLVCEEIPFDMKWTDDKSITAYRIKVE